MRNQLGKLVSLKDGKVLKSIELKGHHLAANCIWWQNGNDLRGWNVHSGVLEYHFTIKAPPGFRFSGRPFVRQYLNLTVYQCKFFNKPNTFVEKFFIIDRIAKKLRECLPPENFNRLRLNRDAFSSEPSSPIQNVSLLWCRIPRGGTIQEQVIANYSLAGTDPISATDVRPFNFDFQKNWKVDQLEHHQGLDLLKALNPVNESTHWFFFDSKGTQIFPPHDRIPHATWVQGKFYIIKEAQGSYTLYTFDSKTQQLDKGFLLEHPVLWMLGMETSLLILQRTPTGLQMRILNIKTNEWTLREFPCQINEDIQVKFDENVLSLIPHEGPPLVFHFSGKPTLAHRQLQLLESSHVKVAEVIDCANLEWKSNRTPKMNPSLPLIRRVFEHCSKQQKVVLACLGVALIILQIHRSDSIESFFFNR